MSGEESDPAGQRNSPNAEPAASAAAPPSVEADREPSAEPRTQARTGPTAAGPRAWLARLRRSTSTSPSNSTTPALDAATELALAPADVWGIAARAVVLGALLGIGTVAWIRFSFDAAWLVEFLTKNRLDMPMRMGLILSMLGGGALGALAVGGTLFWSSKKQRPFRDVEQWLWFLSPLILAPTLPLLLRFRAWEERHDDMLPAILFVGLVFELFLYKSLRSVPQRAREVWVSARSEVPEWLRRHGPVSIVVAGAVAYTVFMSFYTIRWHHKLETGNFDLGLNNNLLYGGLFGDFAQNRIVLPDDPVKQGAPHVQVGAYVFLPVYALWPRPETLQVIQSAALGFGAVPLFLFSRRWLTPWMAATIALCWLAYYPMHGANFNEVKFVPIASFFVLLAAWAADAKRWVTLGVACLIGMLLREDMPIGFTVLGLFLLVSGHRPLAGLVIAFVATSWFAFLRLYVMDDAGDWWLTKMYKDLWSDGEPGFHSVAKTLFSNPLFTLKHVLIEKKVVYLLHLLVPLLFLPARRWYLWAAFVPGTVLTLLVTDYKPVTMFSFEYVMHWAPYLFLAVPLALAAYRRESPDGATRAYAVLAAVAGTIGVLSYNYGAFSLRDGALKSGYQMVTLSFSDEERKRYADLLEIKRSIPDDASVAASEKIGPHLSSRRVFYSLRRDSYQADYLITREKELRLDHTKSVINDALTSGEYGVFKRIGEFALLKRGHSTQGNPALIDEWRLRSTSRTSRSPRAQSDDEASEWGEAGPQPRGRVPEPNDDAD